MTAASQSGPAPGPTAGVTWAEMYARAALRLGDKWEARRMVEEASGSPWHTVVGPRGGPGPGRSPATERASAPVPERAAARLEDMVERRLRGEPLQYVLASWAFRRLDLMVDRRVLIPRPETEQVVEVALEELDRVRARPGRATAVDLGTGSGAIALSVAAERPNTEVWATDASPGALAVASANLAGLAGSSATRVRLVAGDWWSALPADLRGAVDLVVSNPPYIASHEMDELDPQVRDWEPVGALHAGPRGTEAVEIILRGAPLWLNKGGVAVVEIAPHQMEEAEDLARTAGFVDVRTEPDLAGRPRALVARLAHPVGRSPRVGS